MKRSAFAALPFALTCALAGCAGLGGRAPPRYHVLEPAAPAVHAEATSCTASTLLLSPTTAAGFYDTQDIVYSRQPGTRSYYQLNHWTEPPSRSVDALLTQRLARRGTFCTVAAATDGIRGTLLLSVHLDEIYHDAATAPGTARLALTAVLSDPTRRALTARRRFTGSAPAASHDAAGAVHGFDRALGPLLDEVVEWVGSAGAETPERRSITSASSKP